MNIDGRKIAVFSLSLLPLIALVVAAANNELGPDLGKALVLNLGFWALCFLWLTLAISPLKRWTGYGRLLRYRRMLGLYCWFYASLHLLAVMTYMLGWDWQIFIEEFKERPYMALGITAWCLLVPLGLTSNNWAIRRLGKKWKTLHSLVYVIAALSLLHLLWQVRSDYREVLIFTAILSVLMIERFRVKWLALAAKRSVSA